MKQFILLFFLGLGLRPHGQIAPLTPGTPAPDFSLKNIDGKSVSFANWSKAKGYILVFTCNTCPFSHAYEGRIINLNRTYGPKGYPVIAVNPNDPAVSPGDSYQKMVERAKAGKYGFPYLFDAGQTVTNAYGVKNTPTVFLIVHENGKNVVRYAGAIDNDWEDNNAAPVLYLERAIAAVGEGMAPEPAATKAIGCTVRRKKQ